MRDLACVSIGVPVALGECTSEAAWAILGGENETAQAVQTRVLARWPDGSVKWLLATFPVQGDRPSPTRLQTIAPIGEKSAALETATIRVCSDAAGITIDTGAARFFVSKGEQLIQESGVQSNWLAQAGCRLLATSNRGRQIANVDSVEIVEAGPRAARIAVSGSLSKRSALRFAGSICFHANTGRVRVELTVHNPRRARHRGGYWDLGDPGSVFLEDLSLEITTAAPNSRRVVWTEQPGRPEHVMHGIGLKIRQESSGGENWRSRNHVSREGEVPLRFRGYRVRSDKGETLGDRASPTVALAWEDKHVAVALEEFWQKFPSAIEVEGERILMHLWPKSTGPHELQAGEQNTRVVWLDFGIGGEQACERLAWVHDPPKAFVDPEWIASSGAIPFLPSPEFPQRRELLQVLDAAIDGGRSFFAKREVIDEYGWRNFGDMWADHEEVYCDDPRPVVSHYNNQYDLLYGLLVQFLQSGDRRWWELADPLARHVMDIDIYHTDRDKPAYNGGLFWHTAHYHDGGTCTHRTHSKTMVGKSVPAPGGGPANEHNYTSGLLLYHYLTGNSRARECVVGLAEWVIKMDDGRHHVLGIASDLPTGSASCTTVSDYHGPGRGAGNSINALMDGWLATEDEKCLTKAIELIRRTIHPADDIAARELNNAELRWSYTVHLQALARFLVLTADCDELGEIRAYTSASILHYARWMATNETFYLDEPEALEYPTETWAAQELRKGNTLLMAARLADEEEACLFRRRGSEILDEAWRRLLEFDSYMCTRAVAIVLQQGYLETWLKGMESTHHRVGLTYDV
jgi:hypothetical protein